MSDHKFNKFLLISIIACCILIPSYCQSSPVAEGTIQTSVDESAVEYSDKESEDPLEFLNRPLFAFNQLIDGLLLKPAAYAFRDFFSEPVRTSIAGVFDNLGEPVTFCNDVLQMEGEKASQTLTRFLINSTVGLGGLFDVAAKQFDIKLHRADLGQTLGIYGIEGSPYLVLPLFGPSNFRDAFGRLGDFYIDPYNLYMLNHDHDLAIYLRAGLEGVVNRERALDVTNTLDKTADPYVQYRSLYLQNRDYVIKGGIVERESPVPTDISKEE